MRAFGAFRKHQNPLLRSGELSFSFALLMCSSSRRSTMAKLTRLLWQWCLGWGELYDLCESGAKETTSDQTRGEQTTTQYLVF